MRYKNYEREICLQLHRKIKGWPANVKFDTPYQIGNVGDVKKLLDAWMSGQCSWVKMKSDEHKELQKKLGAEEPAVRKTRSDKGSKRTRDESDEEGAQPQQTRKRRSRQNAAAIAALKKRIANQLPKALSQKKFMSAETVDSDGSDGSEDSA